MPIYTFSLPQTVEFVNKTRKVSMIDVGQLNKRKTRLRPF